MNHRDVVRKSEGTKLPTTSLMIFKEEASVVDIRISTRHDNSGPIWLLFLLYLQCSDMQDGHTALVYATRSGKCNVVTELISLGADVDIKNSVSHFLYVSS